MVKRIITYIHTGQFFGIAEKAAFSEDFSEDNALIAVMLSLTALEAFINESGKLADMVPTSEKQAIVQAYATIMKELEERQESLQIKFHMAKLVFSQQAWNEGELPYQDFKLLLAIRNHLIHLKADTWETPHMEFRSEHLGGTPLEYPERELAQYPKFIRALISKGHIPEPKESTSWVALACTVGVAKWAVETAANMSQAVFDAIPKGYFKNSLGEHVLALSNDRNSS